jgi:hypothetical protein
MKKTIKHLVSAMAVALFLFIAFGSDDEETAKEKTAKEKTAKDFVGQTFDLDTYHRVKFETESRYWIYQKPLNCGGNGNWSIENGKIILGSNDSNCESTRAKKGSYEKSRF